ncbi:MAG: TIGR02301 family protein [Hyphomicrobiales bacterium]
MSICDGAQGREAPKGGGNRRLAAVVALWGLLLAAALSPDGLRAATAPPPQPQAQPYDAQLLRLSEILGALSYLNSICEPSQKDPFRPQMQALLDAEATTSPRREEFAGAYNRGYRGLAATYARCTENARALISRFREEGVAITRQVRSMYGG